MDELFGKPAAEVMNTLREYVSMVQVRAPDAPVVVVFTKADQVPGVTPDVMPAAATRWVQNVVTALCAEFNQVVCGGDGDESACCALVLSSQDGWEARRAQACSRWAQLALACSGAGDKLPASYGKLRDALRVVGGAWKGTCVHALGALSPVGMEGEGAGSSIVVDAPTTRDGSNLNVPLAMQWGAQVPIVTVEAVKHMAVQHCGLAPGASIHQPLLLLHHMGCVVYGGALAGSDADMQSPADFDGDDTTSSYPDLSQLVVLDPQWLANMLSRVVTQYAKHRDNTGTPIPRGQVPLPDVALAWHGYPDELRGSFLEVLFALEVAFPGISEDGVSDSITVPALLPVVPSNTDEVVAAMLSARKISAAKVGVRVRPD